MLTITPAAQAAYPGAKFGLLAVEGLSAATERSAMDGLIATEISALKSQHPAYERQAALAAEPLCHYAAYYKKFGKSYHVLGQLESVLLKGKGLPPFGAPVESMFLAEIKNLLLTAGHDADRVAGALTVDVAKEAAVYQGISGKESPLKQDDLYLADETGVLSSIIGGPDYRTRITGATARALYFIYGVPGVGEARIAAHLQTITAYLAQAMPGAAVTSLEVY